MTAELLDAVALWNIASNKSESIKEYLAPYLNQLYKTSPEYESLCTIPDKYLGKSKN